MIERDPRTGYWVYRRDGAFARSADDEPWLTPLVGAIEFRKEHEHPCGAWSVTVVYRFGHIWVVDLKGCTETRLALFLFS
jgi:hypothetical protein